MNSVNVLIILLLCQSFGQICANYCAPHGGILHIPSYTCWWLGELGESCLTVCNATGFSYALATKTVAGSDAPDRTACDELNSLFMQSGSSSTKNPCTGGGNGCTFSKANIKIWCQSPATTASSAYVNHRRYCSCDVPRAPSAAPTAPTTAPTVPPTAQPTAAPSAPTQQPTSSPTVVPTFEPSKRPTKQPTAQPYMYPTRQPTTQPTTQPTAQPTLRPTLPPTHAIYTSTTRSTAVETAQSTLALLSSTVTLASTPSTRATSTVSVAVTTSGDDNLLAAQIRSEETRNAAVLGSLALLCVICVLLALFYYRRRRDHDVSSTEIGMMSKPNANAMSRPPSGVYANADAYAYSSSAVDGESGEHGECGGKYTSLSRLSSTSNEPEEYSAPAAINVRRKDFSALTSSVDHFLIASGDLKKEKKIGEGNFGAVFVGRWHGDQVAIKVVKADSKQGEVEFFAEAAAMCEMRPHTNVVQLYGVCRKPLMIVMEYCVHGSLESLIKHESPILNRPAVQSTIVVGVARGLAHLHRLDVVHRDVAARNVLIANAYVAKISDFGMARTNVSDYMHLTAQQIGPIRYMAPEQFDNPVYSKKTDAYAFGVFLYEVYQGEQPWTGRSNKDVVMAVARGDRLALKKGAAPQFVVDLMSRLFSLRAASRPTMSECVEILQDGFDTAEELTSEESNDHSARRSLSFGRENGDTVRSSANAPGVLPTPEEYQLPPGRRKGGAGSQRSLSENRKYGLLYYDSAANESEAEYSLPHIPHGGDNEYFAPKR